MSRGRTGPAAWRPMRRVAGAMGLVAVWPLAVLPMAVPMHVAAAPDHPGGNSHIRLAQAPALPPPKPPVPEPPGEDETTDVSGDSGDQAKAGAETDGITLEGPTEDADEETADDAASDDTDDAASFGAEVTDVDADETGEAAEDAEAESAAPDAAVR